MATRRRTRPGVESIFTHRQGGAQGGLAEYVACARDGIEPGGEGWWEDSCLIEPWGFELAEIPAPVLVLHGREDRFVPFGHGRMAGRAHPGREAALLDHDGHLTLLEHHIPEVHAWLAEHL